MSLPDRWDRVLNGLRDQGRYRELSAPAGVDFSSNDYLGYCARASGGRKPPDGVSVDVELLGGGESGGLRPPLAKSGTASRLLRGHHPVWDEVESALATWHAAESALLMTSGYVANEGLLSTAIEPGDWVASDEFNHASIIDGLRLSRAEKFIFRHHDLRQLDEGLRTAARDRRPGRELFVVTESLFGMDGDITPLAEMATIAERHGAHLIVDEAHATGCFGPGGSGLVDAAGLRPRVLATVHTGGKALGVMGAYICGSTRLRELLINRCRHLIFTTALPPALGPAWLSALERVRNDDEGRERLHGSAAFFRGELARHGVAGGGDAHIVPVILGDDARAARTATRLRERGWDVRAIRPPSVPPGTARLRVSVHADHDRGTLAALALAIAEVTRP